MCDAGLRSRVVLRRRPSGPWRLVYGHAASSATRYADMDFLLDLLPGRGIAAAVGIRPFLPALLVGALAAADLGIDFEGTDFAFLEEAPSCSRRAGAARAGDLAGAARGPDAPERPANAPLRGARASCSARCCRAGSLADQGYASWPGVVAGAGRAPRSASSRPATLLAAHPPPPRRRGRRARCRSTPTAPRSLRPGSRCCSRRSRSLVIAGAVALLRRRAPARGREVRRPAHPAVSSEPKKLVLAVIDAHEAGDARAGGRAGRAPALKLLMERGAYVDDCVAAFPSVTPVCAASIATGAGPDGHRIPSMNWYHRVEGRYVEYGSSFQASQAFGFKRSLTDTIYNMNMEHLSPEAADGLRAARRRRHAHRRHDLPHVPRPPPPRGRRARPRSPGSPSTVFRQPVSARASSSTPTCSPRARPAAARSSGCPASATSTPAASARTWSSTTCSTSCCSRCRTTTPTRTARAVRPGRPRSPPPTASSSG